MTTPQLRNVNAKINMLYIFVRMGMEEDGVCEEYFPVLSPRGGDKVFENGAGDGCSSGGDGCDGDNDANDGLHSHCTAAGQ